MSARTDRRPESYTWPLVAIVIVILPQVLVPAAHRIGPPLLVPIVEALAFLVMLVIAAKPGPVLTRLVWLALSHHACPYGLPWNKQATPVLEVWRLPRLGIGGCRGRAV